MSKFSEPYSPPDQFRRSAALQIFSALLSRIPKEKIDDDVALEKIAESAVWLADRLSCYLCPSNVPRIRSPSEISVTEREEQEGRDPLRLAVVLDELYQAKMRSVLCSALIAKLNGLSAEAPESHVRIPKDELERLCELTWKNTKVLSELCGTAEFDLPKGTEDNLIV